MRLSHSAKETYLTCPKKWQLHYQERLRSYKIGSALFFGNAIDEALNTLLLGKKRDLTESEKMLTNSTPEETFTSSFSKVYILDEYVDIAKSEQAEYYKSDLDLDLLEMSDYLKVIEFAQELNIDLNIQEDVELFVDETQKLVKKGLDTDTQRVYNYICWLSLYRKGPLLLDAYRDQVYPEIEEVFDVQKTILLPDGGDKFVGVIDLICSFNDNPGVKYVCDNKTSSRAYRDDSVVGSEQLAAYSEYEQNSNCAYIVLEKKIRKRDPNVRTQIIKDIIPSSFVDQTFDKLTEVFHNIKEEKFDKNFDSCFQYGKKCPYYEYCRTGGLKDLKYLRGENK